uniref:Uncharacterized protein n=1 Tax=Anguilla anguilla TaxID=7936 RepID=A0A0E9VPR6_ANGAN
MLFCLFYFISAQLALQPQSSVFPAQVSFIIPHYHHVSTDEGC